MHERSLVKSLIELVTEEANARHLGKIHGIQLEIGEFSGVESQLVESAFHEMAPDYWSDQVTLQVEVAQLAALCQQCHREFHVKHFHFICPHCTSCDIRVISGEEIRLLNIVAERQTTCGG
jgi:hydrogenase nickel incorporation protein HypA/HybF